MIEGLIGAALGGSAALLPVVFAKGEPAVQSAVDGIPLARYLPWRGLVRPNVVKCAEGYLAAWTFAGPDPGLMHEEAVKNVVFDFAAFLGLPTKWPGTVGQVYVDRSKASEYDRGLNVGENPVYALLDELREAEFTRRVETYRTERFFVLTWSPPNKLREALRAATSEGVAGAMRSEDDMLAEFERICREVESALRVAVSAQRLSGADGFSDVLRLLNRFGPEGVDRLCRVPPVTIPLHEHLAREYRGGSQLRVGRQEIGIVNITMPAGMYEPQMLQPLADLAVAHTLMVRTISMTQAQAQTVTQSAIVDFKGSADFNSAGVTNPDDIRSVDQMTLALGNTGDAFHRHAWTTTSIVLRAKTRAEIITAQQDIIDALPQGYAAEIPESEAFDSWLSTLPGNKKNGMRRPAVDTLETAYSLPLLGQERGERFNTSPHYASINQVPCVTYAVNRSKGLFRFHLNPRGSDLPSGIICAPSTSGKSVLIDSLAALWCARLPQGVVNIVERGRSSRPMAKMLGGAFFDVLGEMDAPGFSLFVDAHIPAMQGEITALLEEWVEGEGTHVSSERRKSILEAVKTVGPMPEAQRTYTAFLSILQSQQDGPLLAAALETYGPNGVLGSLCSNTKDTFRLNRLNVIDVTNLRAKGERFVTPILRLIFWKIDSAEAAMRRMHPEMVSLLIIDEQQEFTNNPFGAAYIARNHMESRKYRRGIWLVGPTIKGFASMQQRDALLGSAQTRIYGPDTSALAEGTPELYYATGLPYANGVASLPSMRKRTWKVYRPDEGVLDELDFCMDEDFRAVIGDSYSNVAVDRFIQSFPPERFGDRWKTEILLANPSRQVQAAGYRLRELSTQYAEK